MPKYVEVIPFNNINKETALAIGYIAMQQLNWDASFAVEDSLVSITKKNWKSKGQQIVLSVADDCFTISSEMINGEMGDITGKNKKNVAAFINAFELAKAATGEADITTAKTSLKSLKEITTQKVEAQMQLQAEVDKAMNLSGSNLYATYAIIAINVLVFILMVINGSGLFDPNGYVHIQWGSNYTPLTLSGDWWRLITNIFIHFGIIHIAMNMYCLYTVGIYLEPMLGKARYMTAYLCTGVLASIVSLWWHNDGVNSAGASGAIFGVYGLFLALLTTSLVPEQIRKSLLQSIGVFIAFNLFYGMKSGVDNSAHVGGLVSGFIIGYGYVYGIKKEKRQQKANWILPAAVLLTAGIMVGYLQQHKAPTEDRTAILREVKSGTFKDNEKFNNTLAKFDKIHESINAIVNDTAFTDKERKKKIDEEGLPQLQQAEQFISNSATYNISPGSHSKAEKLLQYIGLLKNELELIKTVNEINNTDKLNQQLNDIREKENAVFTEVLKL